jgi:hypothetical protein
MFGVVAEGEELSSNILSQDFARLRGASSKGGVLQGVTRSLPLQACVGDRPSRRCAGQQPP